VHNENVKLLPFEDEALAASVGATVEELNAEQIDPFAAEVVFDALSRSMSGVVYQEDCDAQRSSFVSADGAFDAEAFAGALTDSRLTIAGSLLIFPGLWIGAALAIAIHWGPVALELFRSGDFAANVASADFSSLLLPGAIVAIILYNVAIDRGLLANTSDGEPPALGYREQAVLEADRVYLERMKRRRRGEKDEGPGYIDIDQAGAGYLKSVLRRLGVEK
jgi:hypothetical protein